MYPDFQKPYKYGESARNRWNHTDDRPDRFHVSTDPVRDLIVCRTREADKVREGDVIAFFDPAGNGRSVVTHRVRKITKDEDGNLAWVTKGDANNTEDQALVPAENLVGIYRHRVAGLGSAAMFLQTTQGMILCVICPILLMVVCDTICRRRNERSEKKAADALRAELETLRAEKEKHI